MIAEQGTRPVAVVTGANVGIGKATAQALAQQGFTVVLACRSEQRAQGAIDDIRRTVPDADLQIVRTDMSELAQVREAATTIIKQFDQIDVLVNNAGYLPGTRELAAVGVEKSFCVNHLAPMLFTSELLPRLAAARSARIVNVATDIHRLVHIPFDDLAFEHRYGPYYTYSVGKLALVMATHERARRLRTSGIANVTVNSLHPGYIRSEFGDDTHWWIRLGIKATRPFLLSSEQGARTQIHVATSPEVEGVTGRYFKSCRIARPSKFSQDEAACARLWAVSEEMINEVLN